MYTYIVKHIYCMYLHMHMYIQLYLNTNNGQQLQVYHELTE